MKMFSPAIALALIAQVPPAPPSPDAVCLDLQGREVIPLNRKLNPRPNATVLIFYLAECPISRKLTPEINRIYTDYAPRGVRFYMVHEDLTLTQSDLAKESLAFGLKPTVIIDRWHTLMAQSGATVSPQAVVYNKDFKMVYRGRINDRFYGLGKSRSAATYHDLRVALTNSLRNPKLALRETKAIGCLLPKN